MAGSSSEGFQWPAEGNTDAAQERGTKDLEMGVVEFGVLRDSEAGSPIENLQATPTEMGESLDASIADAEGGGRLEEDFEMGCEGTQGTVGTEEIQAASATVADVVFQATNATQAEDLESSQAHGTSQSADSEVEMGSAAPTSGDENPLGSESKPARDATYSAEQPSNIPRALAEGRVPLWIKWRGRWQSGIQCSLEDCPAATVKAMPTYGRKMYIVVYFPSTRSFVWTDWQLVCPITESPEPLAFGSHESGRNAVVDLIAARRYMLRKISAAMLDISDRLPVQAVVECARHVSFWKEFAKEAAKAVKYEELGVMLVQLKSMILPTFLKETWRSSRFEEWKRQCEGVDTAASMEKLVKELKNTVCWDDVNKIWDELEQTNLDSEWKTWKEYAHRENLNENKFQDSTTPPAHYFPVSVTGHRRTLDGIHDWGVEHARLLDAGNRNSEQQCKRLKSEEQQSIYNSGDNSVKETGNGQRINISSPSNMTDPASSDLLRDKCITPQNGSSTHSNNDALFTSKTQSVHDDIKTLSNPHRCSAFSERRGRQCNKFAGEGSLYCWKHGGASGSDARKKGKSLAPSIGAHDPNAVICSGTTKYARRCTHKAREGSAFCLKHLLQDVADPVKGTAIGSSVSKTSIPELCSAEPSDLGTPEPAIPGSVEETPNGKRKLEQITRNSGRPASADLKSVEPSGQVKPVPRTVPRTASWTRCIGWCRGSGGQCSHRAKPGCSYCEKHLPGSLGYGPKPQEKYFSKEVFTGFATSSSGSGEKNLLRLRDLVHEYMKARLDDVARNNHRPKGWQKLTDWILSEVAGDLKASELLYDLLTAEMEGLKKFFGEEEVSGALVPYIPRSTDAAGSSVAAVGEIPTMSNVGFTQQFSSTPNAPLARFRCRLCPQEFVELLVLSQHWRACHRKEAQQSFRGYTCHYCSLPFTNKKGLERHSKVHHAGTPSQSNPSLVALCIICSGQLRDFEDLWQHVIHSHSDQLCASRPVAEQCAAAGPRSGLEIMEIGKCFHCDQRFSTYAERRQHEEIAHRVNIQSSGTSNMENSRKTVQFANENKYKCKICGLRFRLLPDLGRHHQAKHKPVQAMQLKNGKEEIPTTGLVGELNSNVGAEKEKKRLQKLDVRRGPGGSQSKAEAQSAQQQLNQLGARDPIIAEIENHQGPKISGLPSNKDILAVARFACCKNQLCTILNRKYTTLPERLSIKAAKLCSEANVRIQFHREGYVCSNGCREFGSSLTDIKPSLNTSFPSASFVPLQLTVQANNAEFQSGDIILDKSHLVLTASSHIGENHSTKMVLCQDLSFGKEMVPIPCVVDTDVMGPCNCPMCVDNQSSHSDTFSPWVNFSYVTKRLLEPSLGLDTKSSQLGCTCQGSCLPEKCEHIYLFDNDNTDARDIYGKPMTGRFPYDIQGCIILEEGYLVYECNSVCNCLEDCQNRVLQKGVRVKLEVYKTRHKGWAVRAAQPIARGTFVCEYIGEVLDDGEANKRGQRYDKEGCSYLYDIDAHIDTGLLGRTKPFVIDATKYGNVARFINHSCLPNLVNYQVLVESMDCQLAHIGLYATRDIEEGEELAYDYRYKLLPGKGCPCHCGAKDCRGRLY